MAGIATNLPYGADQALHLVIDPCGLNASGPPNAVEKRDLETVIIDLMSGQFSNPVSVVVFNTLEHWTDDVSQDIAREIQCRCDRIPDHLTDFFERLGLTHSHNNNSLGRTP